MLATDLPRQPRHFPAQKKCIRIDASHDAMDTGNTNARNFERHQDVLNDKISIIPERKETKQISYSKFYPESDECVAV